MLTLDQILSESRDSLQVFDTEKTASAQPSTSLDYKEVEKMAGLLKVAKIPSAEEGRVAQSYNIQEKIAEALIIAETVSRLADATEYAEKIASFRKEASDKGFTEDQIEEFIEKEASKRSYLKKALTSKPAKALLTASALGATAAGSSHYGAKKQKKKDIEQMKDVARMAYGAGLRRGVSGSAEYFREKLRSMRE